MTKKAKQRIIDAKIAWMRKDKPDWTDKEIGWFAYYTWSDNSTNGLTHCIIDFLIWSGHQAERVNTMGVPKDNTKIVTDVVGLNRRIGSVEWRRSGATPGSADIHCTLAPYGRSVKIEVKFKKDTHKDAQKKYEARVNNAGGIYVIAKTMDGFFEWYDSLP